MTSRTPPNPGTAEEASLRSQSRLIIDSIRSPSCAASRLIKPKPSARGSASVGRSKQIASHRVTISAANNGEEQAADGPSMVLLGLRLGQSLCGPPAGPSCRRRCRPPWPWRQQDKRHHAVIGPLEPAHLEDEAAQQAHVRHGQDRPAILAMVRPGLSN